MKVTLTVPNFRWCDSDVNALWHYIPYNLCLLAAMLEDMCEVSILDAYQADMSKEEFQQALVKLDPNVVGITVLMDQYLSAGHDAARLIKGVSPDINVVFGGVSATMNPEGTIADDNVDYVVMGEGEYVLRELIKSFMGVGSLPEKGICYRVDGKVVNAGHSDFIDDLDALPLPAYHLIDFKAYANSAYRKSVDAPRKYPYGRVLTSRGCPCGCVFCQVEAISGRKFRARSAKNVLAEIRFLKETYGIKSLIFDDDNVLGNKRRARELFQGMIDEGLAMPWLAIATAVFKMDTDLVKLMRASGCEYIDVAIESGTQRVLKDIINKPVDLDQARAMVRQARQAGIFVAANFILGFPTETWDEIRQSLEFAEELDADYIKLFAAIPLPKTRLWDMCEKEGVFKDGAEKGNSIWATGKIETDDFTANDVTILRAYEWDRLNFTKPSKRARIAEMMGVTEQELYDIRRRTCKVACSNIQ